MAPQDADSKHLMLRGRRIREDVDGHVCLDDIFAAAKGSRGRDPKRWRDLDSTKRLEKELFKKVVLSDLKGNTGAKPVGYAKRGRGNLGTYAHPILAAAYAGYLHPSLKIEMLEVWLRYRQGDATLADEILERASPEANLWAATRAMGRARRRGFTDALKSHGVEDAGYGQCTDAVYREVLGGRARQIKAARNLASNTNLRNSLNTDELAYVMAAEVLATDRIEEEDPRGNNECAKASQKSARHIREAIERDKKDRQRRMVG